MTKGQEKGRKGGKAVTGRKGGEESNGDLE